MGGASCSASYSGLCASIPGSQRNYTSSNTQIIVQRSEPSIVRAPRVISSTNPRTANTVNARVTQNIKNTITPSNVVQNNNEVQRRYYERTKPQTSRYRRPEYFSRRRQSSPCTNFLCRIANIFS